MSITFSIEALPTGRWVVECIEGRELARTADRDEALRIMADHKTRCEECREFDYPITGEWDVTDDLDVNLSTVNAQMLLLFLGLDADSYCGAVPAEDFLARVLLARAEDHDDTGAPATVTGGPGTGSATWVECGVPAGYYDHRLTQLEALAEEARRLGRDVTYA